MRFHLHHLPHEHGFLYHFNDVETGAALPGSEVSPIDTALFLCGALTARAHFHADREIVDLATRLYERVDWPWMQDGGPTLAMGWRDGKFLASRWNHYCELMLLYLLAIGSPTHPIAAAAWHADSALSAASSPLSATATRAGTSERDPGGTPNAMADAARAHTARTPPPPTRWDLAPLPPVQRGGCGRRQHGGLRLEEAERRRTQRMPRIRLSHGAQEVHQRYG